MVMQVEAQNIISHLHTLSGMHAQSTDYLHIIIMTIFQNMTCFSKLD